MKRIAEWFAAVGAAAGRKGKRLVAIVAAVAMLGGVRMPANCEGAPVYQIFEE